MIIKYDFCISVCKKKKNIVSFVKRDINDKNIYFQLQILQSCSL